MATKTLHPGTADHKLPTVSGAKVPKNPPGGSTARIKGKKGTASR